MGVGEHEGLALHDRLRDLGIAHEEAQAGEASAEVALGYARKFRFVEFETVRRGTLLAELRRRCGRNATP